MRSKYQELKINTITIAVANIGSKALAFILAPLYSYYLTMEQYGTMDLITTTAALLVPFICFDIFEATFRYTTDKNYDEKKVFSSSIIICVPGFILLIIAMLVTYIYDINSKIIIFTFLYSILDSINNILTQYIRGQNKMKAFAATGIISSFAILISNVFFLILLNMKLTGWLISFLISKVVVFLYLIVFVYKDQPFSMKYIDKNYIKCLLRFCIPLMPTATMWWIMNASDRYFITFFVGTSATGIYSVANKIPSILSVFENIFYQSWQTTAINTMNDNDRDYFYSQIFNNYITILCIGMMSILLIGKPMILLLYESSYSTAWICMAPLIIAVMIHALNGNLGSLYFVLKKTKGALYSTVLGALINIILNLFFIPNWGVLGASISTLIGYIATLLYRWIDIKKFVNIKLDGRKLCVPLVFVLIHWFLYYVPGVLSYGIRIIFILVVLYQNRKFLLGVIRRG